MMWWLLVPGVIAILAAVGRGGLAIALGLFFDLLWGPPVGALSFMPLPFALLALGCVLTRAGLSRATRYRIPRTL